MNSYSDRRCRESFLKDLLINTPETKIRRAVKESELYVIELRRNSFRDKTERNNNKTEVSLKKAY